jgi:2-desacetyl-2-hydroxyethyl bacteriochlorophyllide A dehydrogenase
MENPVSDSDAGPRLSGRALVGRDHGRFALEEVVTAPIGPTDVGVRTTWSGVSIGTEFAALTGKLDYGPFPMTTGYMGVGIIEQVGSDVAGFSVGDRLYYGQNNELRTRDGGERITCASGVHASVAVVDPLGAGMGGALVPDGVPDDVASMFVIPAVGLLGVDMAEVNVGASVVVIGAGPVGLSVVAAASARGARVVSVDLRQQPLEVAKRLGAAHVVDTSTADLDSEVRRLVGRAGADFVFEATGHPSLIDAAIDLCRPRGCFVWQGNYGKGQVSFEFLHAHERRIRMVFPCGDGGRPFEEAVMTSLAHGWLDWEETITHRVDSTDAPALYEQIRAHGAGDILGATIHWD